MYIFIYINRQVTHKLITCVLLSRSQNLFLVTITMLRDIPINIEAPDRDVLLWHKLKHSANQLTLDNKDLPVETCWPHLTEQVFYFVPSPPLACVYNLIDPKRRKQTISKTT